MSGRVESSWPNLTNVGPSSSSISRRCRPRIADEVTPSAIPIGAPRAASRSRAAPRPGRSRPAVRCWPFSCFVAIPEVLHAPAHRRPAKAATGGARREGPVSLSAGTRPATPPSTGSTAPVVARERSETRNATRLGDILAGDRPRRAGSVRRRTPRARRGRPRGPRPARARTSSDQSREPPKIASGLSAFARIP